MERPRTALVLYGSETGNAQDVAEEMGRMTERLRFDTTVLDMDSIQLRDLVKSTIVIFALSTTGQGEMPQNARSFWRTLLSSALKPGLLRKVRFSSFGLGDSSYPQFNVAHRMLCGRMSQLGAQLFCERGEGNEQHPEGHSAGFREWIVALKKSLVDRFPLPDGIAPMADDEFVEPKWKLELDQEASLDEKNGVNDMKDSIPSPALLPVKSTHTAELVSNDRVTAQSHFQDVRLMDLRIKEDIKYGPGAVAVIYPKNFPENVQEFIELMAWSDIADKPIKLVSSSSSTSNSPSPLRHLDLSTTHLTLRWLLENVLDIMSIPRRTLFASLANFVKEDTEDEKYQKERLLELANPELIDELWDYTTRPKRTIVEAMSDFTLVKIPWQYVLTALPIMRGRQFSIASGGHLRQHQNGQTIVQLLVAIANPPSPIIKYRRRYGVCTRYIASLKAGQTLNIGLQPGYLDVQPDEINQPVILIGPGTGVAPMRSMIYQRLLWFKSTTPQTQSHHLLQDTILIFGCRAQENDYFFREEWDEQTRNAGLTVLTAFSRDPAKPKQYVQDQIRANGEMVKEALFRRRGKVYVCGSSGNMPKGVREALIDVLSSDEGMARNEAEGYIETMEKQGRYKQETW
ncbi:NADPH-dependent diflavin oxidoreductase 1 [Acrodontium crateriforme]|uniref:NADPH-dependent diflavin oxidoreductase 1 n=1 Tax=Acrodontium crateriforme TaxID=150365 RepID=A0AAQ3R641_9PEZI|nr:NADPH-dependent diflavin oxidoreductase 1 [Acrodontium crateriforme]